MIKYVANMCEDGPLVTETSRPILYPITCCVLKVFEVLVEQ